MSVRKIRKQIHFHKNQRWAASIIILTIVGIITHGKISKLNHVKAGYNNEEHVFILKQLKDETDSIQTKRVREKSKPKLTPKYFNPNKTSIEELTSMGIQEKDAKSWMKYITKGGKFYRVEDLKKLYSMNDRMYNQLKPYAILPKEKKYKKEKSKYKESLTRNSLKKSMNPESNIYDILEKEKLNLDSIQYFAKKDELFYKKEFASRRNKMRSGINNEFIISINETDSIELRTLKGIGPVLSSRIIKYKEQLGGFHNKNQLLEVYGVKPTLLSNILDRLSFEGPLRKIKINTVTLEELVKHPYFDYSTAHIFINYRIQHGDYRDINDIKKIRIIKDYWLEETAPYFDFEPSL